MSDYREVEVILVVVGTMYNPMTSEQPNKIVTARRMKLFPDEMPIEEVSEKIMQKVQELEDSL